MTEKEKAFLGLLYDANADASLLAERNQTKHLLFKYNHLDPLEVDQRKTLMRKILGKTKKDFCIEQPFYCDYGTHISIGENFYSNVNCVILDGAPVTIGDHVFIAPMVGIYTAGHPLEANQRNTGLEYAYPITIGNNVWIGAQVIILPGVTIGNNTVIGAGSVVTKDIPDDVLALGNPCKVLRSINKEKRSQCP